MVVAEWREMCMFQRLVAGMKERKEARPKTADSRDSPILAPPKMITPHESPSAYIDDTAPFRLGEASDIPLLPRITTTKTSSTGCHTSIRSTTTTMHSSSNSCQQGVRSNDWFVEDTFDGTAITSTVDDSNDDEEIFSMDI